MLEKSVKRRKIMFLLKKVRRDEAAENMLILHPFAELQQDVPVTSVLVK